MRERLPSGWPTPGGVGGSPGEILEARHHSVTQQTPPADLRADLPGDRAVSVQAPPWPHGALLGEGSQMGGVWWDGQEHRAGGGPRARQGQARLPTGGRGAGGTQTAGQEE